MSGHDHSKTTHRIACDHVVPGCTFTASAENEEALVAKVAAHAREVHGVTDVSPELAAEVRAAIERQ